MTATTAHPIGNQSDISAHGAMDSTAVENTQPAQPASDVQELSAEESSVDGLPIHSTVAVFDSTDPVDGTARLDPALLARIIEAALLAAQQPLSVAQLQSLFPEDAPVASGAIGQALHALREACVDRGVELIEVASGFRYQVRNELQPWVSRLWTERQAKYSRATLETLALIAYRQPITRGEIEQVRGVAVNSNLIKTLEEREWIRVVGHRDVPGKPELLGTTRTFLDYFGLKSLDALPPLSELHEIPELDPQLPFETVPVPAAILDDLPQPGDDDGTHANALTDRDEDDDTDWVMGSSMHLDSDSIDSDSDALASFDDAYVSPPDETSDEAFHDQSTRSSDIALPASDSSEPELRHFDQPHPNSIQPDSIHSDSIHSDSTQSDNTDPHEHNS